MQVHPSFALVQLMVDRAVCGRAAVVHWPVAWILLRICGWMGMRVHAGVMFARMMEIVVCKRGLESVVDRVFGRGY